MQKIQPTPNDFIRLWEDYSFMLWCESLWCRVLDKKDDQHPAQKSQKKYEVFLQTSPRLLAVLQAYKLTSWDFANGSLFDTRLF
jgi:hypothetical protein